uniref:Uncharacterized protein n=1 Tax=Cacopsylla melanoneura TaxID=428564 RepID=A0A8D8YHD6_9HEMI
MLGHALAPPLRSLPIQVLRTCTQDKPPTDSLWGASHLRRLALCLQLRRRPLLPRAPPTPVAMLSLTLPLTEKRRNPLVTRIRIPSPGGPLPCFLQASLSPRRRKKGNLQSHSQPQTSWSKALTARSWALLDGAGSGIWRLRRPCKQGGCFLP